MSISMKNIIVASNNKHKIQEIQNILQNLGVKVLSLKEVGIEADIEENGETFMENAYIKAKGIYDLLEDKNSYWVLSDDSGLSVDVLNGEPGVYSARYAGEHGNDKKNNIKLLNNLKAVEDKDRSAKFICAMVLIMDEKNHMEVQGEVKGYITREERGTRDFGYDPLFYVPSFGRTFGELSDEDKNSISHRGNALKLLKEKLEKIKVG